MATLGQALTCTPADLHNFQTLTRARHADTHGSMFNKQTFHEWKISTGNGTADNCQIWLN